MDEWSEVELGDPPKLHPTAEISDKGQLSEKKKCPDSSYLDWTHAVVALSAIILLVITYTSLIQPDLLFEPTPAQLPPVDTRMVTISGATHQTLAARPPDKVGGRSQEPFQQLDFQIYRSTPNQVESLDLRYELLRPLSISPTDSYRLLLKPNYDQYIYLFLVDPTGDIQALQGRLNKQQLTGARREFLPEKPNWFYLQGVPGDYNLYLISSTTRINEIDDLYNLYLRAFSTDERRQAAQTLDTYIKSLETAATNNENIVWHLTFQFGG